MRTAYEIEETLLFTLEEWEELDEKEQQLVWDALNTPSDGSAPTEDNEAGEVEPTGELSQEEEPSPA